MATTRASGSVQYRGDITGVLLDHNPREAGFIGQAIAPAVAVKTVSDYYWKLGVGQTMNMPESAVAKSAMPDREEYDFSQSTFKLGLHELEWKITKAEMLDFDQFALDLTYANLRMWEFRRRLESDIYSVINDTTAYPLSGNTGQTVGTKWDVAATASITADVNAGITGIQARGGPKPDALIVQAEAYRQMSRNKELRETIGLRYIPSIARSQVIDPAGLADALGLQEILIADAWYNSANKNATATIASIWTKTRAALICRNPAGDGMGPNGRPMLSGAARIIYNSDYGNLFDVYEYGERVDDVIGVIRSYRKIEVPQTNCVYLFAGVL